MMIEQQQKQEEPYKRRLNHLKQYIRNLKQHVQYYEDSHISGAATAQPQRSKIFMADFNGFQQMGIKGDRETERLRAEIKSLRTQIQYKEKRIFGHVDGKQKIQTSTERSLACPLKMYSSRARVSQSLSRTVKLLNSQDWQNCNLYQQQLGFVLIKNQTLEVIKISLQEIQHDSIERQRNCITFLVSKQIKRHYILNFMEQQKAVRWFKFIFYVTQPCIYSFREKWKGTQVRIQQEIPKIQLKPLITQPKPQISIQKPLKHKNQQIVLEIPRLKESNGSQLLSGKFDFKKKPIKKESADNLSFFISQSSDKNQKKPTNLLGQELVSSFKFSAMIESSGRILKRETMAFNQQPIQEIESPINRRDTIKNVHNHNLPTSESLFMTKKLIVKLEQKKRLLSQSSTARLGIHWHQGIEQEPQSFPMKSQKEAPEVQQYMSSPISIKIRKHKKTATTRRKQPSTERDSESPKKLKRVESATREKSNSRESESNIDIDPRRKKTDFSLQLEQVESADRKKASKHEIRDHYLQRLIQKEAIKQISKSSGKGSSEQQVQQNFLLPLPQQKPSSANLSKYSSARHLQVVQGGQESFTQQQKQSTELQVQIQELKNGIVLEKCSKDAWSTKEKKLYISNLMTEICYCDVHNSHEEKKHLIRDIKSIEYGRVSKGILKHKKKRCDEGRCLLIRIDHNGKQKLLEFYLQDSQPAQNLQDFAKKLHFFVQQQNLQDESISY